MIMPDYLSFNHVIGALQIDNDYWTTSQLSRHLEAPFKYLLLAVKTALHILRTERLAMCNRVSVDID